ncbi:MAG: gamma-glutamyltransferase [Clostridia bacterium]|nr:gamma-glutamyltransferase [Clostridia bacterium]MBR6108445.1 gamma-glutamyltransferase [Clostridia bacterium]
MEKKSNQKNKGLIIFVCIALVLAVGLGAIVYLPKLLANDDNNPSGPEVISSSQPAAVTAAPGVTADPNQTEPPADLTDAPVFSDPPILITSAGGVSCSNPIATAIGNQVLENGGNAVDAAVAVAFALGVLEPYASGIGGGGGMLVYDPATDSSVFYDYRDAAGADMSMVFGKTGVPGFVLGMETAHNEHGTLPWGNLLQPAIEYADNGFAISESFARHLQTSHSKLSSRKNPQFYNGSRLLVEGEMIRQTELADTYRLIQRYGSNIFYGQGQPIRQHIIEALNYKLTDQDFDNYKVIERTPVEGVYMGRRVISAPAPFSGTTLIQMLEIAEAVDLDTYETDLMRYAKIMASVSSVTLRDRRRNICDPAYHEVPGDLLSEAHMNELIEQVRSGNPEYIETDPEHESTTHISVIDKNGMMVSMTNTLSDFFGLGTYTDGFFLNDTMVTSSQNPTARNYCLQGQRPRSFACPTVIVGDDGFKMALGSSGGDRIPQSVMQVLIRYFKGGETLQDACDKPRIVMNGYNFYMEDRTIIDPDSTLEKNGFNRLLFSSREYFGAFNAVGITGDGTAFGAADQRRNGSVETTEP